MRIAIDYHTAITPLGEVDWTYALEELLRRSKAELFILCNDIKQGGPRILSENLSRRLPGVAIHTIEIPEGRQAQDVLGADVWIHGRVDRVIGETNVETLYTKMNAF